MMTLSATGTSSSRGRNARKFDRAARPAVAASARCCRSRRVSAQRLDIYQVLGH